MKILVIGSGGREHALVWALQKGSSDLHITAAPGNSGIEQIAHCANISATDIATLAQYAEQEHIDLTVVGGEAPLAAGIVDVFERRRLLIAGPSQRAAQLESSKGFAKDFMARHWIPTAEYRIAGSTSEAIEILDSDVFGGEDASVVIKADGLAAGKGVLIAPTRTVAKEAVTSLGSLVGSEAAQKIVLEETLVGREASLLLFADGRDYALMPAARDHKRIGEGDTGPNTGGMGAITDPSVLDEQTLQRVVKEIVEPTLAGSEREGFPFRGILFIGLMLTPDGPRVLEYNVRFGDPEAQAILVRLQTDLVSILSATARGELGKVRVEWSENSSACVVLAARGYPEKPETGDKIEGLEAAGTIRGVNLFHAGTVRNAAGDWRTAGGRVLGVTSAAPTLQSALGRCYDAIGEIHFEGMQFRRDIGSIATRIEAAGG